MRVAYLDQRRHVRGRPQVQRPWQRRARKYKGDLKSSLVLSGLVTNDYYSSTLHMSVFPLHPTASRLTSAPRQSVRTGLACAPNRPARL
jgi:hypothetical protein